MMPASISPTASVLAPSAVPIGVLTGRNRGGDIVNAIASSMNTRCTSPSEVAALSAAPACAAETIVRRRRQEG
jgi:hypothetical protein